MKHASPAHFILVFLMALLTAALFPKWALSQNRSLEPLPRSGALVTRPAPPPVGWQALQSLGVPDPTRAQPKTAGKVPDIYKNLYYNPVSNFGINQAAYKGGLLSAAGLPGQRKLAEYGPCITGSATSCSQYGAYAQNTVSSALGHWYPLYNTSGGNYNLNLLNAYLPGGQSWNQFQGQYPAPGGQGPDLHGTSYQGYADAIYSQAYSPQIQAILGFDPNASYNFTSQFINYTSSLFSPTVDWNTSFSLFPPASGSPTGGRAAGVAATSPATLASRYAAVAHQQLANQYLDPALSNLRVEGNWVQMGLLLQDPYYMYNTYLVNFYLLQIYANSPSYGALVSLTNEIAGWTNPPTDEVTLAERYFKRYLLNYYQAQVQYEALLYLYSHPQDQQLLTQHANQAHQSLVNISNSPDVISWYNDYLERYLAAQLATPSVEKMMSELLADYPAFRQYLDLLQEIRVATAAAVDRPAVVQATNQVLAIQNDQSFTNAIAQMYVVYKNRVNELLGQTSFILEMERYYEYLNGLIVQDPTYQTLQLRYQETVRAQQTYQYEVAQAVNNCWLLYGQGCDAYNDPTVTALVQSGRAEAIAVELGLLNEEYSTFWFNFYQSEAFKSREMEAQQAVAQAIALVIPQINAAREEYQKGQDALPQRKAMQDAMLVVAQDLRSVLLSDSTTTVGSALDQMATLAASLEESESLKPPPADLSSGFTINAAYPNPFSSTTTVAIHLPVAADVRTELYDLFGRLVLSSPAKRMSRGRQTIALDGSSLKSGLYLFKVHVQVGSASLVKGGRIRLLK